VTQPDRPAGRGHKLTPAPVKRAAEALGLRVFTPEKLKPFVDEARALGAGAFVVASYGKIVPQALLDVVPIAFNVHPSLLPLYRGATPLQSAIRDGRTETGVSIIAMDAGMDTGDVLLQERTPIGPEETYGELHDRIAQRGAEMAVEAIERYANGTLEPKPQWVIAHRLGISDDEIARTLTRPLRKEDLKVDWYRAGRAVLDQIRSLVPRPLARAECYDETVKIVAAHAVSRDELFAAGVGIGSTIPRSPIVSVDHATGKPMLSCEVNDGVVVIDRLVPPNRGPMTGEEYGRRMFAAMGVEAEELRSLRVSRRADAGGD
jgi:methionyl-tRNA formyltransferase